MASQSTINTYDGKSVNTVWYEKTPEKGSDQFHEALNEAGVDGFIQFETVDGRWLSLPVRDVQSIESYYLADAR